jgi:histidinol-phosphate phosphatase family protein
MGNRAAFLDRDGTIAKDVYYCRRPEDFVLLPTVSEAIRLLNENGFKVVVITNQSGIARGYFTDETLAQIHQKMAEELGKNGARVDAIYYCPHHPDDGCECRKPGTALFYRAAHELDIDLKQSFVIGDTNMDINAGKAIGATTLLVTTGPNGSADVASRPDFIAPNLLEGANWIVSISKPLVSVIVPAYNEERALPIVLAKIFGVIDRRYELIVVDDGSTDRTAEVASQFPCRVIRHEVNRGKGEALKSTIRQARGENIIWIDADDSYPVKLIPRMAEALDIYDMVVCSRKHGQENIPQLNRIGNFIFRNLIRKIYGFKPYDPCSGLYGAKKSHLEMMGLSSRRFAIEPEISIKGGRMKLKMLDIPIEYRPRLGETKLSSLRAGWEDMWTIFKLILWRPGKGKNG